LLFNYSNDNLLDKYKKNTKNNQENIEKMIINIIGGILLTLLGSVLILDVLTYKYSKAFAHQNFSGWLMGITYIIGGIYMIIDSLLQLLRN